MNIKILVLSALSMGIAVNAQQVNIRGKVSDSTGKAVANAIVEIARLKYKDTTGTDGTFTLNFISNALQRLPQSQFGEIALERGVLVLSVANPAPLKVEIFDVKGNLLDRKVVDKSSAGIYRLDLAGRFPAGNLLIVKASLGSEVKTFQYFQTAGGDRAAEISLGNSAPAGARLAKMSATIDTLKISAPGFTSKSVLLSIYDTTINVTLSGTAGDIWGGLKNPPKKSAGCGKTTTVTSGKKSITYDGSTRSYIIDIPTGYDMNTPYKFFYTSHWISARAEDVQGQNYYFLKPLATSANQPAIFLAPQALPGNPGGTWSSTTNVDQILFDKLLAYVEENLCIDVTRVFATGFSFGGMMTYSLSENHQSKIRAAVGIAPANYNIYVPPKTHEPIAWMHTTGLDDQTCPWVNNEAQRRGAKFIALDHAADNGCTIPATVPIWTTGNHLCYDFVGCKPGYPVKACTFKGGHTNQQSDPGSNANWIPDESWKFFQQF